MHNPLFINTVLLGGSSQAKIAAAAGAGFDQIELWRQDVDAMPRGVADIVQALGNIALTDFQVLMDFDGAPGAKRKVKREEAVQMLDMAMQLDAGTLLVPASTDPDCDPARVVDDLVWLAQEAAARQLRIAYEGMAWSTINHTTPSAWNSVQQAGQSNLGMVIDAFHIFTRGRTASDIDGIPAERIFLVQLSDLDHAVKRGDIVATARHRRLLPGASHFPIGDLLGHLKDIKYAGPIGLEVFNDTMKGRDPATVATEAMTALRKVCTAAGIR